MKCKRDKNSLTCYQYVQLAKVLVGKNVLDQHDLDDYIKSATKNCDDCKRKSNDV